MLIVFFFALILTMHSIKPTNLTKSYSQISEKPNEAFVDLTNVFNFIG